MLALDRARLRRAIFVHGLAVPAKFADRAGRQDNRRSVYGYFARRRNRHERAAHFRKCVRRNCAGELRAV